MSTDTTTDLAAITTRVSGLDESSPFTDVANTIGLCEELERRLDEIKREAKAVAAMIIKRNGAQVIGDMRWVIGCTKREKVKDPMALLDATYSAAGGEVRRVVDCLSANAFKPGAIRKLFDEAGMPEQFEKHFETTYDDRVELKAINTRFVK